MTQDQWLVLAFKIVTLTSFFSLLGWVAIYTSLAKWWRNDIGRTLVVKTSLIALVLVPTILSLFFHFNRLTSHLAGWFDVVMLGLVAPVMWWRSAVFLRLGKSGKVGGLPAGAPHKCGKFPVGDPHHDCED